MSNNMSEHQGIKNLVAARMFYDIKSSLKMKSKDGSTIFDDIMDFKDMDMTQNTPKAIKANEKLRYNLINKLITLFQGDPENRSSRYASLNLFNLKKGGYGTIEIRLKHGSCDSEEIVMYINLFIAFIISAIQNKIICELIEPSRKAGWWLCQDTHSHDMITNMFAFMFDEFLVKDLETIKHTELKDYFAQVLNFHMDKTTNAQYQKQIIDPVATSSGGGKQERKYRIFCYGSNGTKQLKERTGAQCLVPIPAYLENYTRIFAGYSSRWDGGVASVHPEIGARCYGMVIELNKEEMDILDSYEGGYTRVQRFVVIHRPGGNQERVKCYLYIKDNKEWNQPPSIAYLQAIRRMLDECNRDQKKNIAVRGLVKDEGKKTRFALKTFGFFKNGRMCTCKSPIRKRVIKPKNKVIVGV